MRVLITGLLAFIVIVGLPVTSESKGAGRGVTFADSRCGDLDIDLEDGSIIITHEGRQRETVEITDKYELLVNGDPVDLNGDQRELVRECHQLAMEMVDCAKELGWEGAKIGVCGARLGLKAVGNIFKLVFTGYDIDDFEREMEREAAKIEARAARLERKAEKIEDMAEDLEALAYEMSNEIPELDELRWF